MRAYRARATAPARRLAATSPQEERGRPHGRPLLLSAVTASLYLQVFRPDGPLHLFEQQSAVVVQSPPRGAQLQAGSVEQSWVSLQSVAPSQSLSRPSVHVKSTTSVSAVGEPQSTEQLQTSSPESQVPSPQNEAAPQSMPQLAPVSLPTQVPSPQHDDAAVGLQL